MPDHFSQAHAKIQEALHVLDQCQGVSPPVRLIVDLLQCCLPVLKRLGASSAARLSEHGLTEAIQ
jgi:hypothetical protein